MFALRTRHAFYGDFGPAPIKLLRFNYHTTAVRMQEHRYPKYPLLKSVISKIYRLPATISWIIYGIPRQISDVSTARERDGGDHSSSHEEIKIESNFRAPLDTDSSHPQDGPRSISRANINRLRILLGPPKETIRNSQLIPADVIIEDDPQYNVLGSSIYDVHGCTVQDPGKYLVAHGGMVLVNFVSSDYSTRITTHLIPATSTICLGYRKLATTTRKIAQRHRENLYRHGGYLLYTQSNG